jgi:hypothetical protein
VVGDDKCAEAFGTFLYFKKTAKIFEPEKRIVVQMQNRRTDGVGIMFNVQPPDRGTRRSWSYYKLAWHNSGSCLSLSRYADGRSQLLATTGKGMNRDQVCVAWCVVAIRCC